MTDTTFIYGLVDPRNNQLRYVGKSGDPAKRLNEHMRLYSKNKHKTRWLKQLKKLGVEPRIRILQEVPKRRWQKYEKFWIDIFRESPHKITNLIDGGQGFSKGYTPSEETKKKMSKNHWSKQGIKPHNYLTDAELIDRVIVRAIELGRPPFLTEMGNKWIAMVRRFGNWGAVLKAAGLHYPDKSISTKKMLETIKRDGSQRGENNGRAIVTEAGVIKMRQMYATGRFTQKRLSRLFKISHQAVSRIIRRKTWKHI